MGPAGLVLLALAAVPGCSGEPGLRGAEALHQVLVFDAGSSGTRVHVFNVLSPTSAADRQHVPRIDLAVRGAQTLKVRPGLSNFAERGDLEGTEKSIREMLEFASQYVDQAKRAETPVLLKATAGLRAVRPEQAAAVLGRVRSTLASSGYRFRDEWADIILGKEEGGLAWVAANYLQGAFGTLALGEPVSTLGVIEMGGGSSQVSFRVESGDKVAANDEFIFETALGFKFRLYAHSYLGYGLDQARARMTTLSEWASADPCYPHGYRRSEQGTNFSGSGDATQCKVNIELRIMGASHVAPGRYDAEVGLKAGNYIATENFFYAQADLSLGLEGKELDPDKLQSAAQADCGKTVQSQDQSVGTCFALTYQAAVLKALGAGEGGAAVKIVHQIGGADVDWALGAALVHYLQGHTGKDIRVLEIAMLAVAVLLVGFCVLRLLRRPFAKSAQPEAADMPPTKIGASEAAE